MTDTTKAVVLQAHDLQLSYEQRTIINNLNLTIYTNEIVILLGPSGVGKSSLLRVLAGLQAKQGGELRLFNEPLERPHPKVAFVFQQADLLPWLNLQDNVAFGLNFKHQPRLTKAIIRQRVQKALAEVGLSHAATWYPEALSGGMAQRAALARALAREPEVLLLDEPLGALDPNTRRQMQVLLRETFKAHQTAAVMVTHDVDEAIALADRIVLLGGQAASIVAEWQLSDNSIIADDKQNALRQEILQAMQSACWSSATTAIERASVDCNDLVFAT